MIITPDFFPFAPTDLLKFTSVLAWMINVHFFKLNTDISYSQSLSGKESACNAGAAGSIPRSGRSLGGGHGNPLHYSFLENPMDRGAWWATVP